MYKKKDCVLSDDERNMSFTWKSSQKSIPLYQMVLQGGRADIQDQDRICTIGLQIP